MAKLDHVAFMAMSIEEQASALTQLQALHAEAKQTRAMELYKELEALGLPTSRPAPKAGDGRAAPKAKYRSKSNPELTWAGRGQKPKWLVAEMGESGKELDTFLI